MKWLAPAKINLSLRVLGRRADGFHDIETLMAPLTLADEIGVEQIDRESNHGVELLCNDPTLPAGPENLAHRAAELFRSRSRIPLGSIRITLTKHIPHGAGLGGGSSDAASVLMALNELSGNAFDTLELARMAGELGSDVAFFVYRSAAVCRGRGELVEPVDLGTNFPLMLLKPSFPVPTPWAYRQWKDSRPLPGAKHETQHFGRVAMVNDLERPVFEKYLLLAEMKNWLLAQPQVGAALMSGSGSTVFALMRTTGQPTADLVNRARVEFGDVWTCLCSTHAVQTPAG